MYVNQYDYKNIPTNIIPGDWFLHLYHAKKGKIGFINEKGKLVIPLIYDNVSYFEKNGLVKVSKNKKL
jgi:hypothetical protein